MREYRKCVSARRTGAQAVALLAALLAAGCSARAAAVDTLRVPHGFHLTLISQQVPGARFITFAPNGDLIVSETERGTVVAIAPGTGASQTPAVVADGLSLPHGLAFRGDELYIATWGGVVKGRYKRGAPLHLETLFADMPEGGDHNHRALALSGDGSIFVSSGSDCNECVEMNSKFATVLRYDADGKNGAIYAHGLRNASGLAFDGNGTLWAVVNQRDNIGPTQAVTDNLPPDELVRVRASGDYGWPYCYPVDHKLLPNPEFNDSKKCEHAVPSDFDLEPHSAPLGIVFYAGKQFPQRYQGAAFVALHGSWNRSTPSGYKVVVVFFKDGRPQSAEDFVTGWLEPSGRYAGRPVGVAIAPDGSLFISDDSGYIYRVAYRQ